MKTLLFVFAFFPTLLFSQIYVEDHDINADEEIKYLNVTTTCGFRSRANVFFDYGQRGRRIIRENKIYDSEKIELRFNGIVDVMNFMIQNGWEVIEESTKIENDGSGNCLFKRKKSN